MTFVSAVLSNSFKSRIASLFSMNLSRLFHCSVIKVLYILLLFSNFYILSDIQVFVNNFFIFSFKLFCILYFKSSFRLTYLSYPVNNFFTFFWQRIYIKNRRIPCRLHVFPVSLSHQRQLANSITLAFKSQPLFTVLSKKDNSCFFRRIVFLFHSYYICYYAPLAEVGVSTQTEIKFHSSFYVFNTIRCMMRF